MASVSPERIARKSSRANFFCCSRFKNSLLHCLVRIQAKEVSKGDASKEQASAIIAARTRIVEGAVGMVEMALERLSKNNVVTLDEDRKAAMVSNLLVVLCGERAAQPVVNTGTIYQ